MDDTKLLEAMIRYDAGDAPRIHHFLKVHEFARLIACAEGIPQDTRHIVEIAAIVHDIGIHLSERKYGDSSGKHQETEGPAEACAMLEPLGYPAAVVERVCYLVAHHHTYTNIDGKDYQILVEADFLVNALEDNITGEMARHFVDTVFKTETGKRLYHQLYVEQYQDRSVES